ncbi:MAG: alcohol dehydrogenase, partial [Planctomycetota bacterium]
TVKGIHNYAGRHLGEALRFLSRCAQRYPYNEIVGAQFSLDQINDAVAEAATGRHIRVAIV